MLIMKLQMSSDYVAHLYFTKRNSKTSRVRSFDEQVNGEFALKETILVSYRIAVQKLVKSLLVFSLSISLEHTTNTQMHQPL